MISSTLDAIKHLLWPTRCASCDSLLGAPSQSLCAACTQSLIHAKPTNKTKGIDEFFAFFAYEGAAKNTISKWKYHADMAAQKAILNCIEPQIKNLKPLIPVEACFIPIPPHPKRLYERGFDPVWTFARKLLQLLPHASLSLKFKDDALIRVRHTKAQASLNHEERLKNLENAFEIKGNIPSKIILIDDVLTTGATAKACAKVLRQAGAQHIILVTLACTLNASSESQTETPPKTLTPSQEEK